MPVSKARSASGRLHQHHRNSSTGSSKVGLNLQLTQKDTLPPKTQTTQLKRNGHSAVDLHNQRTTSPFPRPGQPHGHIHVNGRIQSKERISALQQRRAPTPSKVNKTSKKQALVGKADFQITNSDETDEDEWVSSESGAATPQLVANHDSDGEHESTPVDVGVLHNDNNSPGDAMPADQHINGSETPRAESELVRVETARPLTMSSPPNDLNQTMDAPATHVPLSTPSSLLPHVEPPAGMRQSRSEAPSPTRLRQKLTSRNSLNRNSIHGELRFEMPPHPLIRGQSFQHSLKPAPLAPLTVHPEFAEAHLSSSPPSSVKTVGSPLASPSYMVKSLTLLSPTEVSEDQERRPTRKTSQSSLHSIATLPVPGPSRLISGRQKPDRSRTLSAFSSTSSAAINSLLFPAASRSSTPPLIIHFPFENFPNGRDPYHQFLPPPFEMLHKTVTAKHSPLYDSYERVIRARYRR